MPCSPLAECSSPDWMMEMHAPSTNRTLTLAVCHLPEPGPMILTPWISLVSQCLTDCHSRDDMTRGLPLSICTTNNSSEVASRRPCTQTQVYIQPFSPVDGPQQAGGEAVLATGPFSSAPQNTMGAALSSTYHVPTASYLPGCHMFRIILLPDVCQSFPF